jgi:hypothetical protein
MNARRIILCADDYGLSPGVSRGIRELLEARRLSATSCMVVFPEFAEDGPLLKPFVGRADIGLHFTLTENSPLARVAAQMHLRPPPLPIIVGKLEEQIAKFTNAIGGPPDYIDGHQHIQLLPVVREAVVHVARGIGAYVRVASEPINRAMWGRPAPLESGYLARASRRLEQLARRAGVATNHGFRGPRNFRERAPFRDLFRSMIAGAGEGCLVMCHPGRPDLLLAGRDPIQAARVQEYRYFTSENFPDDLSEAGVMLSRFAEVMLPV